MIRRQPLQSLHLNPTTKRVFFTFNASSSPCPPKISLLTSSLTFTSAGQLTSLNHSRLHPLNS